MPCSQPWQDQAGVEAPRLIEGPETRAWATWLWPWWGWAGGLRLVPTPMPHCSCVWPDLEGPPQEELVLTFF